MLLPRTHLQTNISRMLAPRTTRPRSSIKTPTATKKWDWEPDTKIVYPLKPTPGQKLVSFESSSVSSMLEARSEPGWRLKDILLAAKLLKIPPEKEAYDDEAEMRRVFGLVYDVLRCRLYIISVMNS